jgi:hypothetical protein
MYCDNRMVFAGETQARTVPEPAGRQRRGWGQESSVPTQWLGTGGGMQARVHPLPSIHALHV